MSLDTIVFSHHSAAVAQRVRRQQVVMWVERLSSQSQSFDQAACPRHTVCVLSESV